MLRRPKKFNHKLSALRIAPHEKHELFVRNSILIRDVSVVNSLFISKALRKVSYGAKIFYEAMSNVDINGKIR
jgi:hypothetical protein